MSVCRKYQLVAPILKGELPSRAVTMSTQLIRSDPSVIAVIFSQLIISIRTYAISRKASWVFYLLTTLFIVCTLVEFLGNVWMRIRMWSILRSHPLYVDFSNSAVQNAQKNCSSGNSSVKIAWIHYLAGKSRDVMLLGFGVSLTLVTRCLWPRRFLNPLI